jgi:hypothetical protein
MPAYTRTDDSLTIIFERRGEPTIRLSVPEGKAMLSSVVLLLAQRDLRPGDRLSVAAGDMTDELPEVSRSSHYS